MRTLFIFLVLLITGCLQNTINNDNKVHKDNYIKPLKGIIPLVVILSNNPDSKYKFHTKEEYRKLYSNFDGNKSENAEEYFHSVSHGNFTFSFQDFWGPYDFFGDSGETELKASIINLYNAGFDFKFFDTDGDNVLTSKELLISVTSNSSPYFGFARAVNFTLPNKLKINMRAAMVGSDTNLATIIHEIFHLIGTFDLYGSDCINQDLTIMSCTVNTEHEELSNSMVHLDPWHKIKLGWIQPRIILTNDLVEEKCYDLEVPQYNGTFSVENQKPLLLYDDNLQNYFLVEYRNRHIIYNDMKSYEYNFPDYGVVVWVVSVNTADKPYETSSIFEDNFNKDQTIWVYNPENNRKTFVWGQNKTINPVYVNGTKSSFIIETKDFEQYHSTVKICLHK